jgi:hypothetical protein
MNKRLALRAQRGNPLAEASPFLGTADCAEGIRGGSADYADCAVLGDLPRRRTKEREGMNKRLALW